MVTSKQIKSLIVCNSSNGLHSKFSKDSYGLTNYAMDKMKSFYFSHIFGKLNENEEIYWGTIKELIIPKLLSLLPESVYDVKVYLFYSKDFNGAIIWNGANGNINDIRVNISQPTNKYIESILHEISHIIDSKHKLWKQMFKPTSNLSPEKYKKQRGEIRAREMENLWKKLYINENDEEQNKGKI